MLLRLDEDTRSDPGSSCSSEHRKISIRKKMVNNAFLNSIKNELNFIVDGGFWQSGYRGLKERSSRLKSIDGWHGQTYPGIIEWGLSTPKENTGGSENSDNYQLPLSCVIKPAVSTGNL